MEGNPTGWWDVKEGDLVAELATERGAIVLLVFPSRQMVLIEWAPTNLGLSTEERFGLYSWPSFFQGFENLERVEA